MAGIVLVPSGMIAESSDKSWCLIDNVGGRRGVRGQQAAPEHWPNIVSLLMENAGSQELVVLVDRKVKSTYFLQALDSKELVYLVVIYNKASKSIQTDKAISAYIAKLVELLQLRHLLAAFKGV